MIIDEQILNELSLQATENKRLRMNLNFHDNLEDDVQRLLNAMEPGTVLPVHRHKNTEVTYFVLRGKVEVLIYDDNKQLKSKEILSPHEGKYGIHIAKGEWHNLNVLEKGTVIFEVKKGPYKILSENDIMHL